MPLVKCSDCGRSVSSNAVSCPSCGNPVGSGGSSGASVFERRIQEYIKARYKLKNRSDNTAVLSGHNVNSSKHISALLQIFLLIPLFLIPIIALMGGFGRNGLIYLPAFPKLLLIIGSILLCIIFSINYYKSIQIHITLNKAGKIIETGNVLKKK